LSISLKNLKQQRIINHSIAGMTEPMNYSTWLG
jgi:hypothetical protein